MNHVVAICGTMGSGKSTMLERLSSQLEGCIVLQEDDYNPATLQSVDEVQAWWDRGGELDEFDLSPLVAKLNAETAGADSIVFLETQFGRLHPALRPLIDLQIWIDVDADIAFARKVAQLSREMLSQRESEASDDSLEWLAGFCDSYVHTTRKLFAKQRIQVGQQADERIDGSGAPEVTFGRIQAVLAPLFGFEQAEVIVKESLL
ncbi:MAG: AAA family ATPase [Fuerstiella sp.]|nr:AAA family ATPase [Fuerstiella sp.]MCP4855078.1 AAA family ATPase [Fuerstiella sp.]